MFLFKRLGWIILGINNQYFFIIIIYQSEYLYQLFIQHL